MDSPGQPSYGITRANAPDDGSRSWDTPVSAGIKLIGFLLLLAAVFLGARAVGAHLGPVTTIQSRSGGSGSMNMGGSGSMNMGGQPAQQARLRGGRP